MIIQAEINGKTEVFLAQDGKLQAVPATLKKEYHCLILNESYTPGSKKIYIKHTAPNEAYDIVIEASGLRARFVIRDSPE